MSEACAKCGSMTPIGHHCIVDDLEAIRNAPMSVPFADMLATVEGKSTGRTLSLSPHQMNRLSLACIPIREAFDGPPYLVGSVMRGGSYRDVDVRTILDDDHYDRLGFGPVDNDGASHGDSLWALLNASLSEWLSDLSGLPVDYQIQRRTQANAATKGQPRSALGILGPWEADR